MVLVTNSHLEGPFLQSNLMVNEFPKVLPDEILCVLLNRKINFGIDLILDTLSISTPSYRMAQADLKELKKQVKDILGKVIIHPSVSP